jgi:hypothetical protein
MSMGGLSILQWLPQSLSAVFKVAIEGSFHLIIVHPVIVGVILGCWLVCF